MTFDELKNGSKYLLLDCISGSHAYNLNLAGSDVDKKGLFILPKKELYGFDKTVQLNNETNDEVYFEIGRFFELLLKNNPNILELLDTPPEYVIYRHPLLDIVKSEDFLSKLCLDTFAGYAQTQIKKAKGLNKKINKPIDKERKSVLDFCYVVYKNGSVPLTYWLHEQGFLQENCGLTKIDHFRDSYLLYHDHQLPNSEYLRGIISGPDADDIQLSHVPKDTEPLAIMGFNKDGYSTYCRNYKEYIEWEMNRNQVRYANNVTHGRNYDSKNMMHTFRLLDMAEEIARYRKIIVHRHNRDFLLKIRNGDFTFEELMKMVEDRMGKLEQLYNMSDLPDMPDANNAERILVQIREEFYTAS